MVESFTSRIARLIAPSFIASLEAKAIKNEHELGQKYAQMVLSMDPYEPYMKRFKGVFSEEFNDPEGKLNDPGKIGMWMWAWQQDTDPHFKFLIDWIINTQGNATLKRKGVSTEEIFYCRAKISTAIQIRDEIRRMANLYRDHLNKQKETEYPDMGVVAE